jgi:hypothetical protein
VQLRIGLSCERNGSPSVCGHRVAYTKLVFPRSDNDVSVVEVVGDEHGPVKPTLCYVVGTKWTEQSLLLGTEVIEGSDLKQNIYSE